MKIKPITILGYAVRMIIMDMDVADDELMKVVDVLVNPDKVIMKTV